MPKKHMKRWSIPLVIREINANPNHNVIALHTHRMVMMKKTIVSVGEDVENWNSHMLLVGM